MAAKHVLDVDLARVYRTPDRKGLIRTLGWGDEIEVLKVTSTFLEIRTTKFTELPDGSIQPSAESGFIVPTTSSGLKPSQLSIPKGQNRVLKVDFVDVQQGDGSVLQTPRGKVVLLDGGDNQLFARYLANQFRNTSAAKPKPIDCIVVSHGDADHFAGLTAIHESETDPRLASAPWKRLFIKPRRVYHNGLVKRPEKLNGKKRKEVEMLGATKVVDGKTFIVGLEKDLLKVPDEEMNTPFRNWKEALKTYKSRGPLTFRRLAIGDDDAFDFLNAEGVEIEVLGPIPSELPGGKTGLAFLGEPPHGPRLGHESVSLDSSGFKGHSASHTINGHSIVLRVTYGGFHFLFAGDLNDQASRVLTRAHNDGILSLRSEVFKVPHHGSADFSAAFFEAVAHRVCRVVGRRERAQGIHPPPRHADGRPGQVLPLRGAARLRDRDGGVLPGRRHGPPGVAQDEGRRRRRRRRQGRGRQEGAKPLLRVQAHGVRHRARAHRRATDADLHRQRQVRPEGGVRLRDGQRGQAGAGRRAAGVAA